MRPRGESASTPSSTYVGHAARQSPQWTQVRSFSRATKRASGLDNAVVLVRAERARVAPAALGHARLAARRRLVAEHGAREVERAEQLRDLLVVLGRVEAHRIAERHPADRHDRVGRDARPDVHDAADADRRARADGGAVEDAGAGGDEDVVLDAAAAQMRVRPDVHVVAERRGVVRDAADDRVLHDDAPLADRDRPALRGEYGAEEDAALGADGHLAADGRVGRDVGRCVDAGPFAAMLEDHRRSPSPQMPATNRPGAKRPPGSNAALMPRMSATPSPGSPHTSTCAFTSGVARSTTSEPPRASRPGRSAATSPAI